AEMGAWLVRRAIDSVEAGRLEALPQNPALASKAPRLKKSDGAVDWSRPAVAIKSQVRAFQPWPTTYTFWHSTSHPLVRVLLDRVSAVESSAEGVTPGTVLEVSSGRLVVAAGEGAVSLEVVQPAGKRILPIDQFLRGYRVQPGDRLGPE
ncbi:MAG TPA: methionyl-tRNA formyltransferase, partial [Thermoguttaceae bacterium]|nr:methionyl-tRNA formyltransferase [Thermoguttaceae bacterium]